MRGMTLPPSLLAVAARSLVGCGRMCPCAHGEVFACGASGECAGSAILVLGACWREAAGRQTPLAFPLADGHSFVQFARTLLTLTPADL